MRRTPFPRRGHVLLCGGPRCPAVYGQRFAAGRDAEISLGAFRFGATGTWPCSLTLGGGEQGPARSSVPHTPTRPSRPSRPSRGPMSHAAPRRVLAFRRLLVLGSQMLPSRVCWFGCQLEPRRAAHQTPVVGADHVVGGGRHERGLRRVRAHHGGPTRRRRTVSLRPGGPGEATGPSGITGGTQGLDCPRTGTMPT
jgi:hypothetical protein